MTYIKIKNLFNKFGQPDYKGLDIKQFIAGSQVYGNTYGIFATNENISTLPTDVTELQEADYDTEKVNIQNAHKSDDPIVELQSQNAKVIAALVKGGLM